MRSIILLSALLACAAASAGDVYKWKDKDGRVHYGDKPKTEEAESVDVTPSSGSGEPSAAAAETQAREAECQKKKAQLADWRKGTTMSEVDNLGRTREYTPAERQQFLDMAQKKVDALCAPAAPPPEAAGTYGPVAPPPPEKPASKTPG